MEQIENTKHKSYLHVSHLHKFVIKLEHTENTLRKSHLHIYTFFRPLGVKICVNLHKLCVNYTNLVRRETLIDHLHKWHLHMYTNFFHLWLFPPLSDY